jgi:uncharacterized protein YndB with AHSA1/START domain
MNSEVTISGDRLQITRVFDAPRARVFGWWARAEKFKQWSGCKESTGCEVTMDFRPGGSFTQKMQIGGKGEFSITGVYDQIVEPERIVYHADFGQFASRVTVTVEFFEHGRGTKVVLTHDGCPDEFFSQTVSQGTCESFDKLDSLVAARVLA